MPGSVKTGTERLERAGEETGDGSQPPNEADLTWHGTGDDLKRSWSIVITSAVEQVPLKSKVGKRIIVTGLWAIIRVHTNLLTYHLL